MVGQKHKQTVCFEHNISLRHRILAELVELALAHHLILPIYLPDVPIYSVLQAVQQPTIHQQSSELQRPSGMNPCNILQHPGFYYYAAAICTQRRLEQFIKANREADASPIPNNLANERKVDHRVIVLEVSLFMKSYNRLLLNVITVVYKSL